jgi:hypothetical protein
MPTVGWLLVGSSFVGQAEKYVKKKGKIVHIWTRHKAKYANGASLLNLGTRRRVSNSHPGHFSRGGGKSRFILSRNLDGPHSQWHFGKVTSFLMLPSIEPRFFGCLARSQVTIHHTEGGGSLSLQKDGVHERTYKVSKPKRPPSDQCWFSNSPEILKWPITETFKWNGKTEARVVQ